MQRIWICTPAAAAVIAVFVTPIYYFGMSAQLKMVIDRFYSYTAKLSGKLLKTVLITAAWDSNDDVMPYTAEHYKKLCRYMNFTDYGMILGTGCGTPSMTAGSYHMVEHISLENQYENLKRILPCPLKHGSKA